MIERQIEFLIANFFAPQNQRNLPGANEIARELLVTGRCIVAGDGRIWSGGVGNFIRIEQEPRAVGCSLLRFDLEGFLSSPWAQEGIKSREMMLNAEIEDLKETLEGVRGLLCGRVS